MRDGTPGRAKSFQFQMPAPDSPNDLCRAAWPTVVRETRYLAYRYARASDHWQGVTADDYYQVGITAAVRAASRVDCAGTAISYLVRRVKGAIQDFYRLAYDLVAKKGRHQSGVAKWTTVRGVGSWTEGEETAVGLQAATLNKAFPMQVDEREGFRRLIRRLCCELTEREEEVLLAISYDGLSQDATAKRLGVSDSAISNFKKSAVRKARAAVGFERAAELVGLH